MAAQSARISQWREIAIRRPRGFVEERLSISEFMGAVVPFRYFGAQADYSDRKQYILKTGQPLRMSELKWRRAGFSSVETAESYAYCYGKDHARVGVIAHEEWRAKELLNNYKDFNDSLNTRYPHLKQELSRDNLFGIRFENTKAQALIATAENPMKIKGDGLHVIHLSEFCHYLNRFNPLMNEVCVVVPAESGSMIVMESTGSIMGSAPYRHYYDATPWDWYVRNGNKRKRGCNEFVRHFACWRDYPMECRLPFLDEHNQVIENPRRQFAELLDEIREVEPRLADKCALYNLTPEQWNWCWRWFTFKGNNNFPSFSREFPFVEEDAWTSGSESYFGNYECEIGKTRVEDPRAIFLLDDTLMRVFDDFSDLSQLAPRLCNDLDDYSNRPILKVWSMPQPGERYVLACDSAQGDYQSDFTAGYIVSMKTREMVACYHGRMKPAEAAHINVSLCRIYKRALCVPETNPCGGGTEILNTMQRLGYHHFYNYKRYDHKNGIVDTSYLGWYTGPRTRDKMLNGLNQLFSDCVRDRIMLRNVFRDKGLLREMRSFVPNEQTGKPEAMNGCYDDRVFAMGIAHQAITDELAGGPSDILKQEYHNIRPEKRAPIDQAKLLMKARNPARVIEVMTGKGSGFGKNKFEMGANGLIQM